jgi:hypothetical protein
MKRRRIRFHLEISIQSMLEVDDSPVSSESFMMASPIRGNQGNQGSELEL